MKTSIFKKMAIAFAAFAAFAGSASAYTEGDIDGTTGTGTENDPIQVNTFSELKAALENTEIMHVELGDVSGEAGYIYNDKSAIVDGQDYGPYGILPKGTKFLNLVGNSTFMATSGIRGLILSSENLVVSGSGTLKFAPSTGGALGQMNTTIYGVKGFLHITSGTIIAQNSMFGDTYAHAIWTQPNCTTVIDGGLFGGHGYSANNTEISFGVSLSGPSVVRGGTFEMDDKLSTSITLNLGADAIILAGNVNTKSSGKSLRCYYGMSTCVASSTVYDLQNNVLSTENVESFSKSIVVQPTIQTNSVTVTTTGKGYVMGTRGNDSYLNGEPVFLKAIPDKGYIFAGWKINGVKQSEKPVYEFVVNQDVEIEAEFIDLMNATIVNGIVYRVDVFCEVPEINKIVAECISKTDGVEIITQSWVNPQRYGIAFGATFLDKGDYEITTIVEPTAESGLTLASKDSLRVVYNNEKNGTMRVRTGNVANTHTVFTLEYYSITFLDDKGAQIGDVVKVGAGKKPVPPAVCVKEDDETYHYITKWSPEIVAATEDATYQIVSTTSVPWTEAELVGSGTEADPYLIGNAQALRDFAAKVNSGKEPSAWAVLMADIDLNPGKTVLNGDGSLYNNGEGLETWTPIGTESNLFAGTFEGNSLAIRGLYINDKDKDYAALFGDVASTAKIQNVGVVDSYIKGKAWVGSIAGVNEGSISNVYNTGFVSGNGNYVGGVVGYNKKGSASNAYNIGSVSGTGKYVGGLIGYNSGTVSNAYNVGSVIGSSSYVGGVVGLSSGTSASVSNSYYNTDFFSESNGYGEGKTSAELAALGIDEAFKFAEGEENPWTEGTTVSGDGFVTYKFPYLTAFGEKSQPVLSPAIEFAAGNASATVYGATTGAVNIPDEIEVSGDITFNRTFPDLGAEDAFSTIMLPFESASKPTGVTFYTIGSISEVNGKWKVTAVVENGDIAANTPYLVKVASGTKSITFNGGTFKATEGEHSVTSGNWKFVGTYEYKAWEKGDAGLGKTYGFAANDGVNDPSIVGKFAKIAAGAYIYPMRAYLEYTAPAVLGRPAANGETRTVASLPDEIEVVIVDKDEATGEETTKVIGSLNTRTGEIKFANDRWFDLQGRYLGVKKPTQKGAYYNNGKKVIVK